MTQRTKRAPIAPERRRTRQVVVRVNAAEHAELTRRLAVSGRRRLATYIRSALLGARRAEPARAGMRARMYSELARTAANINQLTRHLNEGGRIDATGTARLAGELGQLRAEVHALRLTLLGVADEGDGVGGEMSGAE